MTKPLAKAPVRDLFAGMNRTEAARAMELEAMRRSGSIAAWWYEGMTFLLGPDCRYTPDFVVQENDGTLRCEETKGFMRDDALVKLKTFVRLYPFALTLYMARAKKDGGGWDVRSISA